MDTRVGWNRGWAERQCRGVLAIIALCPWFSFGALGGRAAIAPYGLICHWFLLSLVALNRPPLMASRMVDFCFPVAFAACPRVYGKGSASFGLCVVPPVRTFFMFGAMRGWGRYCSLRFLSPYT